MKNELCYSCVMKSKVIAQKKNELRKTIQAMSPEERLVAFLNHSRLMARLYKVGEKYRRTTDVKPCRSEHRTSF